MAEHTPFPKGQGRTPRTLSCAEFESLLIDALDGALSADQTAALDAHRATCAACTQLSLEAGRGEEWLRFLDREPEVPAGLVARILERTSGADPLPATPVLAGMPGAVAQPWQQGWLPRVERRAIQSRWMMTAAMAFFSIAFTLNVTGVRLTGFHLSDLRPTTIASTLTRQFYVADAHVMRYYDNLRFVYELESRVREMRGGSNPSPAPAGRSSGQPKAKTPGSASKQSPAEPSTPPVALTADPVMAGLAVQQPRPAGPIPCVLSKVLDQAERSLA